MEPTSVSDLRRYEIGSELVLLADVNSAPSHGGNHSEKLPFGVTGRDGVGRLFGS